MHDHAPKDLFDEGRSHARTGGEPAAPAADILIGRIVDGEASAHDRERFDELAAANPSLWHTLALRQHDMMVLSAKMDEQTRFADHIDLPLTVAPDAILRRPWIWAFSGWAALLVVGFIWLLGQTRDRGIDTNIGQISTPPVVLSPDAHLREYLKAPYVTGQLPATLVYSQELPDGRLALSIVRRIEETLIVEPTAQVDMDEHGNLAKDPSELRKLHGEQSVKQAVPQ